MGYLRSVMVTQLPVSSATAASPTRPANLASIINPLPRADAADELGSWHYDFGVRRARIPVIPLLCAAALHGLGLYGFNWTGEDEIAAVEVVDGGFLMVMPNLADLEEEEPKLVEDLGEPLEEIEAADFVPMLADVPSVNVGSVFVQKLDYAPLKPRPDLDAAKVVSIPVGPRTVNANAVKGNMANLFDIKDLDSPPSPVFQPAPVFPVALKREVSQATVLVEFIVPNRGTVVEAVAVDSSYRGFEDAAVAGVPRWQFKPGVKGGRPVNTWMRVPLVFRVLDI